VLHAIIHQMPCAQDEVGLPSGQPKRPPVTILEEKVASAWRIAAAELTLRVSSPPPMLGDHQFVVVLRDFGSPAGTLIAVLGEPSEHATPPEDPHFFASILSDSYAGYKRRLFIDTLDDWGYFGPSRRRPAWYSGTNWTSQA